MSKKGNLFSSIALTVILTLLFVLLFGFIIKLCKIPEKVILPVNQFIKVIAVFIGCFFTIKGKMGFLKGLLTGLVATIIIYTIFFIINGEFLFNYKFFIDLIFVSVIGMISGILTVNLKKTAD
ncbi:MAG: TIGR04086 family membrane protein [Clostridiales bacterium]|nr:TIGR04086 family membrane protein [Clostridiales bacterium]